MSQVIDHIEHARQVAGIDPAQAERTRAAASAGLRRFTITAAT